jgi:hypothetical protein
MRPVTPQPSFGSPTSPTPRRWLAASLSLSYSMRLAAGSSAGQWRRICGPSWYWSLWRWRSVSASRAMSSTTETKAPRIHRWRSAAAEGKLACAHPWDLSVMRTTTPCARASSLHWNGGCWDAAASRRRRGQDGDLQLHRGVVQSRSSPFWHPLSIPNRLRDADTLTNSNDLSHKPSTKPGQLQIVPARSGSQSRPHGDLGSWVGLRHFSPLHLRCIADS